jgi:hypothetical protein
MFTQFSCDNFLEFDHSSLRKKRLFSLGFYFFSMSCYFITICTSAYDYEITIYINAWEHLYNYVRYAYLYT